jgi:hypothetical protein
MGARRDIASRTELDNANAAPAHARNFRNRSETRHKT